MRSVLNVGGGEKTIAIPPRYDGWRQVRLDIDAATGADLVMDARRLTELPAAGYDAVYCAHNLEHYHPHDAAEVVRGFLHVLKAPDGFAEIRVPDLLALMRTVVERRLDVDAVAYHLPDGRPVLVRDVVYGYGPAIARSAGDFYAHRNGFSAASLMRFLVRGGFANVWAGFDRELEITAFAFKSPVTARRASELTGIAFPDGQTSTNVSRET